MKCSIIIALMIMIIGTGVLPMLDVPNNTDFDETTVIYEDVNALSNATVNLHGGDYRDDVKTYGNSKLIMFDGTIADGIGLYTNKKNYIYDGVIGGSIFVGNEEVSSQLEISGGQIGGELWTFNESAITIIGHGFNFEYGDLRQIIEVPGDPPSYQEINRTGTLTGTLENGDPINVKFHILGESNITLIED